MKNISGIIWGIVLVILGIILGGNSLGLFDIDIFFAGWWTILIIVPSFIGLFKDEDKTGSIIGVCVGIILLLICQDIIDFSTISKLIFPVIVIIIGLSLIIKNFANKSINDSIKLLNSRKINKEEHASVFSSQTIKADEEVFRGTDLNAIFGGIKLDLRDAIIKEDIVINATAIFGGIDIFVPDNVNIKIKSNSIFGGVDNKKKNKSEEKKKYTIYINATCMFGGVDIK